MYILLFMFDSGTNDWHWQAATLGYIVNHGCLTFPEKVAICLLLPCVEPWELDLLADSLPVFLQCKINVTVLFNLYAGNMLCSLVKKYARDKIWLIFFFFLTGTCSLYRQILSELIFRVAKEVLPFVALSQVTWARRSCHIWSKGPGSQNGKWDVNWF